MQVPSEVLRYHARLALAEDLGCAGAPDLDRDLTTVATVAADRLAQARVVARQRGCLAGMQLAAVVFATLDPDARVDLLHRDGDSVEPGDEVLRIVANARAILVAERTALNFLQRLSGIATATRAMVQAVADTGARILDTRKTTPGLRMLERHAVAAGGGKNHRYGLFDQVLLKENHFAQAAPKSYGDVVRSCVAVAPGPVIAEARTVDEAIAAVRAGARVVLLDNFAPGEPLGAAVGAVRATAAEMGHPVEIEASGGIRLDTIRAVAECGVDRISVGALTHSAPALDLSLLMEGVS